MKSTDITTTLTSLAKCSIPNIPNIQLEKTKREAKETIKQDFQGFNLDAEPTLVQGIMILSGVNPIKRSTTINQLIDSAKTPQEVERLMKALAINVLHLLGVIQERPRYEGFFSEEVGAESYYFPPGECFDEIVPFSSKITYEDLIGDIKVFLKQARELEKS